MHLCIFACAYAYVDVCIYVFVMYVCVHLCMCVCLYYVCIYMFMHTRYMYTFIYLRMCASMHVCTFVLCLYLCVYVYMYTCMLDMHGHRYVSTYTPVWNMLGWGYASPEQRDTSSDVGHGVVPVSIEVLGRLVKWQVVLYLGAI